MQQFELTHEFLSQLEELIDAGNKTEVSKQIAGLHPADIAEILEELNNERAHSRAEARLLRQPSTLAPSAHPRGAFIIVWKRSFLYDKNESCEAGFSACGGSRKRHSSIPLQCDPRGAFLFHRTHFPMK